MVGLTRLTEVSRKIRVAQQKLIINGIRQSLRLWNKDIQGKF